MHEVCLNVEKGGNEMGIYLENMFRIINFVNEELKTAKNVQYNKCLAGRVYTEKRQFVISH